MNRWQRRVPVLLLTACSGTLPPCPPETAWLDSPVPDGLSAIVPLGNVIPPDATFPSLALALQLETDDTPVFMPTDARVRQVVSRTWLTSDTRKGATDHTVSFGMCAEVEVTLSSLATLDRAFLVQVGEASPDDCVEETLPTGELVSTCTHEPSLWSSRGTVVGTSGGADARGPYVHLGATDTRVTALSANPNRQPDRRHAVCPIPLFAEDTALRLNAKLAGDGDPACGVVEVDVPGTAQGVWVRADAPADLAGAERVGLALTYDPEVSGRPIWSFGALGTVADGLRVVGAAEATSGQVNRPFSAVTPPGDVFCYDGLSADGTAVLALVELPAADRLRLEVLPGTSCGAGPWTFGEDAVDLIR